MKQCLNVSKEGHLEQFSLEMFGSWDYRNTSHTEKRRLQFCNIYLVSRWL